MSIQKMTEALEDLRRQRADLDRAIGHVEQAIAAMQGKVLTTTTFTTTLAGMAGLGDKGAEMGMRLGSYIDDACNILEKLPGPIHINDLHRYIEKATGKKLTRASLEGAISRHVRQKGDKSLIVRVAPSTYTVRRHATQGPFQFTRETISDTPEDI